MASGKPLKHRHPPLKRKPELFPTVLQTFCLTICETNTFPKVSVLERGY